MKNLSYLDLGGILVAWTGAVVVVYLAKDPLVSIICVAAAYYLAKWIILKKS